MQKHNLTISPSCKVTLYNEDCIETLTRLNALNTRRLNSLDPKKALHPILYDIIVTSPPYNIGQDYTTTRDNLSSRNYLTWISALALQLSKLLSPTGSLFINLSSPASQPAFVFQILDALLHDTNPALSHLYLSTGLRLQNVFHWIKSIAVPPTNKMQGHYKPINSQLYPNQTHEYVFQLNHSARNPIYKDAPGVGVPYTDPTNHKRWKRNNPKSIEDAPTSAADLINTPLPNLTSGEWSVPNQNDPLKDIYAAQIKLRSIPPRTIPQIVPTINDRVTMFPRFPSIMIREPFQPNHLPEIVILPEKPLEEKETQETPAPDSQPDTDIPLHCRGNSWFIPYETINSRNKHRAGHPCPFPIALAEMCIRIGSHTHAPESEHTFQTIRILDPFCGIGSSALAAIKVAQDPTTHPSTQIQFLGIDNNPDYYTTSLQAVRKTKKDYNRKQRKEAERLISA